ncbi:unnamed protein product [Ophioblennius macclurei]
MYLFLILCGISHLSPAVRSWGIEQDTGVRSAAVGASVTLRCVCDTQVAMHFSWYRQHVGRQPELLSSFYKFDETSEAVHQPQKNPRFSVQKNGGGVNNLHISDVQLSDSATYYCGSSHTNVMEFGQGVFLSVEEPNRQEIVQEPASHTIQSGDSVTFNCTVHSGMCDGEHKTYWFRHRSRSGALVAEQSQCESVSAAGSPSKRCVYHLQKTNVSPSDAGTYYCAVASCGEIVFGRGSELRITNEHERQIKILAWLAIIRTGIVFVILVVCLFVCGKKQR